MMGLTRLRPRLAPLVVFLVARMTSTARPTVFGARVGTVDTDPPPGGSDDLGMTVLGVSAILTRPPSSSKARSRPSSGVRAEALRVKAVADAVQMRFARRAASALAVPGISARADDRRPSRDEGNDRGSLVAARPPFGGGDGGSSAAAARAVARNAALARSRRLHAAPAPREPPRAPSRDVDTASSSSSSSREIAPGHRAGAGGGRAAPRALPPTPTTPPRFPKPTPASPSRSPTPTPKRQPRSAPASPAASEATPAAAAAAAAARVRAAREATKPPKVDPATAAAEDASRRASVAAAAAAAAARVRASREVTRDGDGGVGETPDGGDWDGGFGEKPGARLDEADHIAAAAAAARRVELARKRRDAELVEARAAEDARRNVAHAERCVRAEEKERRRLEVYALNRLLCASETTALREFAATKRRNPAATTAVSVPAGKGLDSDGSEMDEEDATEARKDAAGGGLVAHLRV